MLHKEYDSKILFYLKQKWINCCNRTGYTRAITIVVKDQNGNYIAPTNRIQNYNWVSTNNSVLTINEFGVISGVSVGEATIIGTYKYNNFAGQFIMEVEVLQP